MAGKSPGAVVGVDVGGTFTDLVELDQGSGRVRLAKVPSTADNQAFGVLETLEAAGCDLAARALRDAGCEAVVIHFLHAYANPAHERRAAEIVAELWPNDHITMGHALLSESREFERGVTAAANAAVQRLLDRYIRRLVRELQAGGYRGDLLVMNGNGGMVSSARVAQEAAKTVMSDPASGVMAAAYTGRKAGIGNLITYDMGGTSTDVALIHDAEPSVTNEIEIEYAMPTVRCRWIMCARTLPAGWAIRWS